MATSVPRRELDEIVFLYKFEPTLYDIYVEGPFDASIIRWFLNEIKCNKINIYDISDININKETLEALNRISNNRERLIYLAEYFHENLPDSNQITCVVDKDFDHIINSLRHIPCTMYTDFACMEMYFFVEHIVEKFLCIICNKNDWHCEDILSALSTVLQKMYLFRLANETLQWKLTRLSDIVCVEFDNWELVFNEEEYITRLLSKNGLLDRKEIFLSEVVKYQDALHDDARQQINGHDFIKLFCWYLKNKGVARERVNENYTARMLASASSSDYLLQFDLFKELRKFAEQGAAH